MASSVVTTGSSVPLGRVADFSKVEHQVLAHYTQDQGNHVTIEVIPAAMSILP